MAIGATLSHNGLIWVLVPYDDLAQLLRVLDAGAGTVDMSVESGRQDRRVLTGLTVEPGGEDTLDFQQQGRLISLRSQPSAMKELASALSELANDPTGSGMRQLRLTGYDRRLSTDSRSVVFELV